MGYPVISTWRKAIYSGYFRGWPSLNSTRVHRHMKFTTEIGMGQMDQQRQGTHSTRHTTTTKIEDSMTPLPKTKSNDKTSHVYTKTTNLSDKLYIDQTVRLPATSSQGSCYVVIFYIVDENHIKLYPIKYRHQNKLLKAYDEVYSYLWFRGYHHQLHTLDNETSRNIENFITNKQAIIQYTPDDMHRTNITEHYICNWKNIVLTVKSGTLDSFIM